MKIKCAKAECEVCDKVSTTQLFFRSNGDLAYGRARRYEGRVSGKPQFEYHQQSLQYLKQNIGLDISQFNQSKLGSISQTKANSNNIRLPAELLYMGSIPIPSSNINSKPNLNLSRSPLNDPQFEKWVKQKYAKSYSRNILIYTKKYSHLLRADSNLRELELLNNAVKNNVIKSLLILAKYNGCYSELKGRLQQYGIKASKPNSLDAFLRILNASNSDIVEYYHRIQPLFRDNEQLYAKFLLHSGLRVSEGIESFNLIIELAKNGKLSDYYNDDWKCLTHFKFKEKFIRGTKNTYLTFIAKDFLEQIANSQPVSYDIIRSRLWRKKQPLRLDEFRDYFGTHLINNGILEVEQNLVCGRILISIFIRHYWSPKLKEIGDRILNAISKMESTIAS